MKGIQQMNQTISRTLSTVLLAAFTALAASPAAAKMDCHAMYEQARTTINKKDVSADHREAAFRLAQHAYDLCTVGDEDFAKRFFDRLREGGN